MQKKLLKKIRLYSSIFKLCVLGLVLALVFSSITVAQNVRAHYTYWYTAQVKDNASLEHLNKYVQDITRVFPTTSHATLSRIVQFSSPLQEEDLRNLTQDLVLYLEQERALRAAEISLSDPWFTTSPTDIDRQWGLVKAGFVEAWEKHAGSGANVVAVVDTGIDSLHQDLAQTDMVPGFDFINNQNIAIRTNSDDNGHGTLVGGVIGATADNRLGVAGANWSVSLMPIKALDAKGEGTSITVSQAIVWAADHGAHVINLSIGGADLGHDTTLANAISYAFNKNVIIVAAAGNDSAAQGVDLDKQAMFPVCLDNGQNMVIGVAATDFQDRKPEFSNYGKNCIDVTAPGKRIVSTINHDPITGKPIANAYAYASGTSLAVPYVSAEAALIKAMNPLATNRQIRDRIISSADNIDAFNLTQCNNLSCAGLLGSGRINAAKAVETAININPLKEGAVVQNRQGQKYLIQGGKRRPLSAFVLGQRFPGWVPQQVSDADLLLYPEGALAEPLDGTLLKSFTDPTVYYMNRGVRQPITGPVFGMWNFSFKNVVSLDASEVNAWISGSLLAPPEGTVLKAQSNKTVYWVVGGVLHPVNWEFFVRRSLNQLPLVVLPDSELRGLPKGEAYIL